MNFIVSAIFNLREIFKYTRLLSLCAHKSLESGNLSISIFLFFFSVARYLAAIRGWLATAIHTLESEMKKKCKNHCQISGQKNGTKLKRCGNGLGETHRNRRTKEKCQNNVEINLN